MSTIKLRKIGSSVGAIFPKEVLNELGAEEGDQLYLVKEEPGVYRVSGYDPELAAQMDIFSSVCKRYKNALKELSKK